MGCTCRRAVLLANGKYSHLRLCAAFDPSTAPPRTVAQWNRMEAEGSMPVISMPVIPDGLGLEGPDRAPELP